MVEIVERPGNDELQTLLHLHVTIDAVAKVLGVQRAVVRTWYAELKKENPIQRILDENGLSDVTVTGGSIGKYGVSLRFKPQPTPILQQAAPTIVHYHPAPYILKPVRTIAVISDAQIGYLNDLETNQLEPIHDPVAMEIAKDIVRDVAPTEIDFIGDWMDWTTFTRWQKHPEYQRVVQPSIEEGHQQLASFISAAGPQCVKRIMIGSNHGYRPEKFVLENNIESVGIRRAGEPHAWPVFSEPYLLRYDDLGIEFSGHYPGGEYYVLPDLVLTHAPPHKLEFAATVIHGHTHKVSKTPVVQHGQFGRQTYFTIDTGCLCQVGSASNRRRLMLLRVPSDRARSNWTQGVTIVDILDGKIPRHRVDPIEIIDGTAIYGGKVYGDTTQAA